MATRCDAATIRIGSARGTHACHPTSAPPRVPANAGPHHRFITADKPALEPEPDLPPQSVPIGNARCEHLLELQQQLLGLAGVQAVALEVVDDLQLTGNVALAFPNIAVGFRQLFLEHHLFHPCTDAPRRNAPAPCGFSTDLHRWPRWVRLRATRVNRPAKWCSSRRESKSGRGHAVKSGGVRSEPAPSVLTPNEGKAACRASDDTAR